MSTFCDDISGISSLLQIFFSSSRPRPSMRAAESLGQDLYLVGTGMRAGCLIDSVRLSNEQLLAMKTFLGHEYSCFESITFIPTHDFDQIFAVNLPLIRNAIENEFPWTSFIAFRRSSLEILASIPPEILQCLRGIIQIPSTAGEVIRPLPALKPNSLIALAGYLLEYPFSYYPDLSESSGGFLASVSLVVYTCSIVSVVADKRYSVIKFSCPECILSTEDAQNELKIKLENRWCSRLNSMPFSMDQKFQATYSVRTMDRVAL